MTSAPDLGLGEQRFAVTGATGWIGRAVLETLAEALGPQRFASQVSAFASAPRELTLDAGPAVAVRALDDLAQTDFDVLVHLAFVTREHLDAMGFDRYVAANVAMTARVNAAVLARRPQAVCYASSGAVYAVTDRGDLTEDPYGVIKLIDEDLLRAAADEVGARFVLPRVFNLGGPWLTKPGFAIADLILQARAGGPIRIRAGRPVLRAYMDVADLAAVLVAASCEQRDAGMERFDTAGEPIEMSDLAQRVLDVLGVDGQIERDWDPSAQPDRYVGETLACDAVFERLGLRRRSLDEQIARTATWLRKSIPVT